MLHAIFDIKNCYLNTEDSATGSNYADSDRSLICSRIDNEPLVGTTLELCMYDRIVIELRDCLFYGLIENIERELKKSQMA